MIDAKFDNKQGFCMLNDSVCYADGE